ncbi:MAG: class I lanthipeptide [Phycisphaerae bacterium]|nr:class I lanthipeptide [Phycisphaerae bacterium]
MKEKIKKLVLKRETVRSLQDSELTLVVGGQGGLGPANGSVLVAPFALANAVSGRPRIDDAGPTQIMSGHCPSYVVTCSCPGADGQSGWKAADMGGAGGLG